MEEWGEAWSSRGLYPLVCGRMPCRCTEIHRLYVCGPLTSPMGQFYSLLRAQTCSTEHKSTGQILKGTQVLQHSATRQVGPAEVFRIQCWATRAPCTCVGKADVSAWSTYLDLVLWSHTGTQGPDLLDVFQEERGSQEADLSVPGFWSLIVIKHEWKGQVAQLACERASCHGSV